LQQYTTVAYLALEPIKLPIFLADIEVVSLYDEMAFSGALAFAHNRLENFLLESFYYDFVWIECSQELLRKPWFEFFEQKLIVHNFATSTPILFISYRNDAN